MTLQTKRLILRHLQESDAQSLFEHTKNPNIGPKAGWPPHKNVEQTKNIINTVLTGEECYAICLKEDSIAIGVIELKDCHNDYERELGFWLGEPFWNNGYMIEAVNEIIRHGFLDLNLEKIWCCYYDGNLASKRVQEKAGFTYYLTRHQHPVPLLNEKRDSHVQLLTKDQWSKI